MSMNVYIHVCVCIYIHQYSAVHYKTYLHDLINYLEWTDQDKGVGGHGISRGICRGEGR